MAVNPWVLLGVVLVWIASLVGVGTWQNGLGKEKERLAWKDRETQELTKANADILRLTNAARVKEQEHAKKTGEIAAKLQGVKNELKTRKARDAAAVSDGSVSLRVAAECKGSAGSAASEAGPGAAGGIATATVELPRKVAADLFDLANDADEVVGQLTACQAILVSDRNP